MYRYLLSAFLFTLGFDINAKTLWSDYSVTYLKGNDYELGDASREVYTFEYASRTTWGDNFMFFDRFISSNGDVGTYGEFSPRIKILSLDSFIKNVYFSPSIEMKSNGNNYLVGLGTSVNFSSFTFFNVNAYIRDNYDGDMSFQTTVAWGLPLGVLHYGGFIDFATGYDADAGHEVETSVNFTSQLKYDIAPYFDLDSKVYVGTEFVYWINKSGVDGVDESNFNILVKYHF